MIFLKSHTTHITLIVWACLGIVLIIFICLEIQSPENKDSRLKNRYKHIILQFHNSDTVSVFKKYKNDKSVQPYLFRLLRIYYSLNDQEIKKLMDSRDS